MIKIFFTSLMVTIIILFTGCEIQKEDSPEPFISIWKTDNPGNETSSEDNQIRLPLVENGAYDFTVDWGDGTQDHITNWDDSRRLHTYNEAGIYTLSISGTIKGWSFVPEVLENDTLIRYYDARKLMEIKKWGVLSFGNTVRQFHSCTNMIITAEDHPDLSSTSSLEGAFQACANLLTIPGINGWDISGIKNTSAMFSAAKLFNQDLSGWNTSGITDMNQMFENADSFNQNLSAWNTSSVTNMSYMFAHADAFNQQLNWDTSHVTNMTGMFNGEDSIFNQDISDWDVSKVITMDGMFSYNQYFNQNLSDWETSSVTNMMAMFYKAYSFDQDISSWDITHVTNMMTMFTDVELSIENYNALLNGWANQDVGHSIIFSAGKSKYNQNGADARQHLISEHNWIITDGGLSSDL